MKLLQVGSMPVSDRVTQLARTLVSGSPEELYALAGIVFSGPHRSFVVDLILVTPSGVFVGQEGNEGPQRADPPEIVAQALGQVLSHRGKVNWEFPLYAFWIGRAPETGADDSSAPGFQATDAVHKYLEQATTSPPVIEDVAAVAEHIGRLDRGQDKRRSPGSHLRAAVSDLAALPARFDEVLQEQVRQPFFARPSGPVLPADVTQRLEKALLSREHMIEGADYTRIVPNEFIVEVSADDYHHHYHPIAANVCKQWAERLLEVLSTTNRRWGRKAYRFGGLVQVHLRSSTDLGSGEVRVYCALNPDAQAQLHASTACLTLRGSDRRWRLSEHLMTIGRSPQCDIHLDMPAVQQARLVSSQHAYITLNTGREETAYTLHDGAPGGPPSTNGTFVNGQRIGPEGWPLQDGDTIQLAALDPAAPRADTPGVVTCVFQRECVSTEAV